MKKHILYMLLTLALGFAASAQSTAFTYQGRLKNGAALAAGLHDFRFTLFNAASGGVAIGAPQCVDNILVTEGLFTTTLDFGPQFVTTGDRFLLIEVRADTGLACANVTGFTTLAPRQPLTAAPIATHAKTAFSLAAADGLPANAVFVDNDGKVGVGTTAPTHTIHIASTAPTLAIQDTDSTTQQVGYVDYRDSANVSQGWVGFGSAGDPDFSMINARPSGDIVLSTLGGGNVGIGTTAPAALLDVAGNIRAVDVDFTTINAGTVAAGVSEFQGGSSSGVLVGRHHLSTPGVGVLGVGGVGSFGSGMIGVRGVALQSDANSFGVFAAGRLGATGTKSFRIDHPEHPANAYLFHYCAESPEVINFYRGTVTLDSRGRAVVRLPSYFAKINTNPSYQLTAIGAPMPMLHVSLRISDQALRAGALQQPGLAAAACWFGIDGGVPGGEVSWRVEAVRNDEFVRKNGAPVEVAKPAHERDTTAFTLPIGQRQR